MSELSSAAAAIVANATKKLREEGEAAKSRLLDQQFHISKSFLCSPLVCPPHLCFRSTNRGHPLVCRSLCRPLGSTEDIRPSVLAEGCDSGNGTEMAGYD